MGFPLKIKKVESQEIWELNTAEMIGLLFLLAFLPVVQAFFRGHSWMAHYGHTIFFAGVFLYALYVKMIPIYRLGFSRRELGNHLMVGLVFGGLIVATLPLLDGLLSVSGLEKHELFSEGVKQRGADEGEVLNPLNLLAQVLLFPILKQFFFTGVIFQNLRRKLNPVLAVYIIAVIFTLAHFKLTLGIFLLGLITAFLLQITGTLYASILFHAGCSLAGILLLHVYPRLTTFLVFLF